VKEDSVYEQGADYNIWDQDTATTGATVKIHLRTLDEVFILYIIITGIIKKEGRNRGTYITFGEMRNT
jgi:hypothetical protein